MESRDGGGTLIAFSISARQHSGLERTDRPTPDGCQSELLDVWCYLFPIRGMVVILDDMNDILDREHS
jgi:hypothetical protein